MKIKINYSKKKKEEEIIVDCEYLFKFIFYLKFIGSNLVSTILINNTY